jgi:DNA polymerase-3 subunit delta'
MMPPEPRANPSLVGHGAAEAVLQEAMAGGRMHHAWLITGPQGIGKSTLAFRFARRLLAGTAPTLALPASDLVFKRVAAGTHADLLTIEREWDPKRKKLRGEIIVDDIRRIGGFLRLTPAEGGWRVVIVDGVEDVNRNGANALLKILEEPPPRAVLLLVCAAPGRLLPTIRSRCRRLALAPIADEAMAPLLAGWFPEMDEAQRMRLVTLAEGSPGRALQLADGDGVAFAELVNDILARASTLTAEHAYKVADQIGRDEDAFSTFMDLLRAGIAAAVRDAARGKADPDQARLLGARPLDAWVEVWHALSRLQDETEAVHMDKRQALVSGLTMVSTAREGR